MKRAKAILAVSLAAVMMLSLPGCGKSSPAPSGTASEAQEETGKETQESSGSTGGSEENPGSGEKPDGIQAGTEFSYWINTDYPNYLPWVDNNAVQLQNNLYDNLLYKYHGDPNDVRGNIAESWEVSDDGLVWVFKIKDNVKFTNGKPVTAEAFVKSWDAARSYQQNYFNVVDKYEATGDLELTVTLNTPSPTFIYDLPMSSHTGPVDPELLEQYGPEDNRSAVGCGPYYVEEYVSGEGFTLKANADYHNPDRAPSIETCKLTIIPDPNTALMGLLSGQLDCINTNDVEIVSSLEENGMEPIQYSGRPQPWWFNARETEIFRDPVVREALCHMIDWEAVNDLVYNGRWKTMQSYWGDGAGTVPYGDGYTYDPELGMKMLEDAGYSKDDIAFTFTVNPDFTSQITAVLAQLTELGFTKIEMETYDMSTCLGIIQGGTYQTTTTHDGYSQLNPLNPYSMGLVPDAVQKIIWLDYMDDAAKEAYDECMKHYDAALTATTFDDLVKETEEITRICQDNYCAMGGLQRTGFYGINPSVSGIYIEEETGNLDFCYLYFNE